MVTRWEIKEKLIALEQAQESARDMNERFKASGKDYDRQVAEKVKDLHDELFESTLNWIEKLIASSRITSVKHNPDVKHNLLVILGLLLTTIAPVHAQMLQGSIDNSDAVLYAYNPQQASLIGHNRHFSLTAGEQPVGVLGIKVHQSGFRSGIEFQIIHPESELAGTVQIGDRLLAINGIRCQTTEQVQQMGQGTPGTYVTLTILRRHLFRTQPEEITLRRIDARMVRYHDPYFEEQARRTSRY